MPLNIRPFLIIALCLLTSCAGLGVRSNVESAFKRGLALFNRGEYEEAIPQFVQATELDAEFAQGYLYLGRSYLNLQRWFDAIPALRTALRLAPEETQNEITEILLDALLGAATSAFKQGNPQQSISLFKRVLDLAPQSNQARQGLLDTLLIFGGKQLSQGNIAEAVATYTEATQFAPQNFEAYIGLARAFLQYGEFFKALTAANHARRIAPNSSAVLSLLQQLGGR